MNKRRGEQRNWYAEPVESRARMMLEHGRIGRHYAGAATQVIVVEDNLFADTTGAGLVLTNEPDWPEGPVPWAITVRRNRFLRGGTCLGYADSPHGAALMVRTTRLGHGLAEQAAIRDVVIADNEFTDRAGTAVFVGGARNVTLEGNRVHAGAGVELRRSGAAILIEQASAVVMSDNAISDERSGTIAAVEIGASVSQLFLGVRLECAKCHHHPFEVWSQDDFYVFAAYFARVGHKGTGLSPPISGGEEMILTAKSGSVTHPLTQEGYPA